MKAETLKWKTGILDARDGIQALPPLSVSSQGSSKTNLASPGNYDEFLKQNAAQEKTGESVQTLAVLVIVLLVAMWLCRRWFLRR